MEIPKYSDWVKKVSKTLEMEVDTKSFEALFNKNDGKTPNIQRHNFLKAYAFAVNKIAVVQQQDRFPNLEEVQKAFADINVEVQGQVVYNLKYHIIQFFEKIGFGTKGVYLLPKAKRFKDIAGKYSDLVFDFDNGTVTLPELKPPAVNLQKEPATGALKAIDEIKSGSNDIVKRTEELRILPRKPSVKFILIFGLIAFVLITLGFMISAPPDTPALRAKSVVYSIGDSNDEEGDFIMLDLANPDGIIINSTIVLPTQIYRSFSAEKGTFSSMSYSDNTTIRWKTDKDSK